MTSNTINLPTDLSYACIAAVPIDYEFSGEKWAESTEDGSGWRVCAGSIVPDDLETEIEIKLKGEDHPRTFVLDTDTFEIEVSFFDEDGDEDCETMYPGEDEWAKAIEEHFKLDADDLRAQIDGEDHERWEPMMNYCYPLDCEPPDDWKRLVSNCTCVEIDGSYYLALTGGGMDLSWEICESYMRLGYYPPAHFARLPSMAGRGTSKRDKWIIDGCRKTFEAMRARAESGLRDLDSLVEWSDKYEKAAR